MFLLETSTDETAPRSLKTPRSDCSLLRHHLEGTPTCGKFAGLKPVGYKIFLDGYRLRLLPCVSRQTGRIPRTASRTIQSAFASRNRFAGTSFSPPGYPLCE